MPTGSPNETVENWLLWYFQENSPTRSLWFEIIEEVTKASQIPDGAVTAVFLNLIEQGKIIRLKDEWLLA